MLRVSFNLDDADLEHFAEVAQHTRTLAREQSAAEVVAAARALVNRAEEARPAGFVRERYARLGTMLEMFEDAEWQPCETDRQRTLNALACFAVPAATRSATELLDHAIMIELIGRDLQHDLEAYRDFCRFRERQRSRQGGAAPGDREHWLQQRREVLHARMHQRRKRDLDAAGSALRKLLSLLGL